jgi:heptosyltransferase-1
MPAPRVLFVKLSSLGDVVHHLPAVTELAENRPGVHVELVKLHPGVTEVLPVGLRRLRGNVLDMSRWRGLAHTRRAAGGKWDFVIDAGLAQERAGGARRAAAHSAWTASAREPSRHASTT